MDRATQLPTEPLSDRERELIKLLADGLTNAEIGERLFLATKTVKWHVRQLNQKFYTSNRDEIIERARELGLPNDLDTIRSQDDIRLVTILAPGGMDIQREYIVV